MRAVLLALLLVLSGAASSFAQEADPGQFVPDLGSLYMEADAGDAGAQYDLGFYYETGIGVPQDDAEAAKWYRMAAEQGHARAEERLGSMYAAGRGVDMDEAEAGKWLERAAGHGDVDAQVKMGIRNEQGFGVAVDRVQALMWYEIAADNGDSDAVEWRDALAAGMAADDAAQARTLAKAWREAHPPAKPE